MTMGMIDFSKSAAKKGMRIFESFDHKHEMKKMTKDDKGKTPTNKVICPNIV